MISEVDVISRLFCYAGIGRSVPELNGTTEEKGEYGRASSTVGGFDLVRRVLFMP